MERLILVRHGETDWNRAHRWQGHQDVPLNQTGLEQAQRVADRLKDEQFDAIYASDLSRAFATAEAINQHHKLLLQPEPRLREILLGQFEGHTFDDLQHEFPDEYAAWSGDMHKDPPGGESDMRFYERVRGFYDDVVESHEGGTLLVVGHGGSLRMLMMRMLELPVESFARFRLDNTAISELIWHRNRWNLSRFNDTYHLNGYVSK